MIFRWERETRAKVESLLTFIKLLRVLGEKVFEPVLGLLNRQIKQVKGDISRTYLVGGYGGCHHFRKPIKSSFCAEELGPIID